MQLNAVGPSAFLTVWSILISDARLGQGRTVCSTTLPSVTPPTLHCQHFLGMFRQPNYSRGRCWSCGNTPPPAPPHPRLLKGGQTSEQYSTTQQASNARLGEFALARGQTVWLLCKCSYSATTNVFLSSGFVFTHGPPTPFHISASSPWWFGVTGRGAVTKLDLLPTPSLLAEEEERPPLFSLRLLLTKEHQLWVSKMLIYA